MKISDAELNILGLIAKGARYGYQIEKIIEQEQMREWTAIGFSSIYYIVKKLEKKELVTSSIEITNENKTRKIYEITYLGEELLSEKIYSLLSDPGEIKFPFDLALYHKDLIPIVDQLRALSQLIIKFQNDILHFQELLANAETSIEKIIYRRGISFYKAERSFIQELINEIENN